MRLFNKQILGLLTCVLAGALSAQELKMADPQTVGFSPERLQRLDAAFADYLISANATYRFGGKHNQMPQGSQFNDVPAKK